MSNLFESFLQQLAQWRDFSLSWGQFLGGIGEFFGSQGLLIFLAEFGIRFLLGSLLPSIALWFLKDALLAYIYTKLHPLKEEPQSLENLEDEESLLKEERFHGFYLWARFLVYGLYLLIVSLLLVYAFNPSMGAFIAVVRRIFSQVLLQYGTTNITVGSVVTFAFVWASILSARSTLYFWLHKVMVDSVEGTVSKAYHKSRERVVSLLYYLILGLLLLFSLTFLGINISSVALLLSALGVGIGFGLKDLVENLFSGITLLMFQYMQEGDRVLVDTPDGPKEGNISKIRLFNTIVQTLHKQTLVVPNSVFVRNVLINKTYDTRGIIVAVKLYLDYQYVDDCQKILDWMKEIGGEVPFLRHRGKVLPVLLEIHNHYLHFELWIEISDIAQRAITIDWVNQRLFQKLKDEGVQIPAKLVRSPIKSEAKELVGSNKKVQ